MRTLYLASDSKISSQQSDRAVELIISHAAGNTLATVFAVAEAENVSSLGELASRLRERRLADGLHEYYSSIWAHMLRVAGDLANGIDPCLVAAISLAHRGVTGDFLSRSFNEWNRPAAWWRNALESLGPLLMQGMDGFRVRHNDVRVFLAQRFAGYAVGVRQRVIGQLADSYLSATADRLDRRTCNFLISSHSPAGLRRRRGFQCGLGLGGRGSRN